MGTVINPLPLTHDPRGNDSNGGSGDHSAPRVIQHPRQTSSTGITIGLCAITMSFAALSSAMLVRKGSNDWRHIEIPWLLYLNTILLVASSVTLEVGRRRVATFMRTAGTDAPTHPAR